MKLFKIALLLNFIAGFVLIPMSFFYPDLIRESLIATISFWIHCVFFGLKTAALIGQRMTKNHKCYHCHFSGHILDSYPCFQCLNGKDYPHFKQEE